VASGLRTETSGFGISGSGVFALAQVSSSEGVYRYECAKLRVTPNSVAFWFPSFPIYFSRSTNYQAIAEDESWSLFVAGCSGYIGSILIELAITEGYNVLSLSRSEDSDSKADVVINLPTAYVFGQGKYEDALLVDNDAIDAMYDGLAGYNKPIIATSGTLSTQANPPGKETNRGYGRRAELSQPAYLGRVSCPISTQEEGRQCHAST
jgi:hypothetical protein